MKEQEYISDLSKDINIKDILYMYRGQSAEHFLYKPNDEENINIIFIIDGQVIHSYNGKEVLLSEKDVWVGKLDHNFYSRNAKGIYRYFHVCLKLDKDYNFPWVMRQVSPDIEELFYKLYKECNEQGINYKIFQKAYTYEILGKLLRNSCRAELMKSDYGKIADSVKYIHKNYCNKDISIDEIAKMSGICRSYFRKIFVSIYGESPRSYISKLRLSKADELLTHTTLNIAEIAEMLGFENQYYFSTFYKNHRKVSPIKVRLKKYKNGGI